jgi:2-polyprenyl-3-methyl-5-hydroxy-6-metoxy-1,4-benzoquinol methylase
MSKDLQSFQKHNAEYLQVNMHSVPLTLTEYARYDSLNKFEKDGFKQAIETTKPLPKIHIDIGSGIGWLTRKTSPYFKKVYGIEPSQKACEISGKALEDFPNVSILCADMIDGLDIISPKEPVFITSSIVLSHITDNYVKSFLDKLSKLPNGSACFFDERYGKNIQRTMWHIRNKFWWANALQDWQLNFFQIKNNGYNSGIYGIKVGKEYVTNTFQPTILERASWIISGIYYKIATKVRESTKKLTVN